MGLLTDTRVYRSVLIVMALLMLTGAVAFARQGTQQSAEGRQSQLIRELQSEDKRVRRRAAEELGRIGGDQAMSALMGALRDRDQFVCAAAALALGEIKDKRATGNLVGLLRDVNSEVRGAAAVALGRINDSRAVEPLLALLSDPEAYPRSSAAVALGRIGDSRAAKPIATLLLRDADPQVRTSAAEALGQLGDTTVKDALINALKDSNNYVRTAAASALGQVGTDGAVPSLIEALKDPDRLVRSAAAEALGRGSDVRAVRPLIEALSDSDQFVRTNAAYALGRLGDRQAVEPLMDTVHLDDVRVKSRAIDSLGAIGDARALPVLIDALGDKDRFTRGNAVTALGKLGDKRAVDSLVQTLSDQDGYIRKNAVDALGKLGDERSFDPLLALVKKEQDKSIRVAATSAIAKVGGPRAIGPLVEMLQERTVEVRNSAAVALSQLDRSQTLGALLELMAKVDLGRMGELKPPIALIFKESGPEMGAELKSILSNNDLVGRQRALLLTAILAEPGSLDSLLAALKDPNEEMRTLAALLIGRTRDTRAAAQLRLAINDKDAGVRTRAAEALALMGLPKYELPAKTENTNISLLPPRGRTEVNLIAAHTSATAVKTRAPRPLPGSPNRAEANTLASRTDIVPAPARPVLQPPPAPPQPEPETRAEAVSKSNEQPKGKIEPTPNETVALNRAPATTTPEKAAPTVPSQPATKPAPSVTNPQPVTSAPAKPTSPPVVSGKFEPPTTAGPIIASVPERTQPKPEPPKIEPPKVPTIAQNEATIISMLQKLLAAQQQYHKKNTNFAALERLIEDGLVDAALADGEKNGYELTLYISPATARRPARFFIIASPLDYGRSGERSFFIDETGILRTNRTNNAIQIGQVYGSWNRVEN